MYFDLPSGHLCAATPMEQEKSKKSAPAQTNSWIMVPATNRGERWNHCLFIFLQLCGWNHPSFPIKGLVQAAAEEGRCIASKFSISLSFQIFFLLVRFLVWLKAILSQALSFWFCKTLVSCL